MSIQFFTHEIKFQLKQKTILKAWIEGAFKQHKKTLKSITYVFCSDEYLLEINQGFLQHDFYTDIITFDYSTKIEVESEIYISIERVKENAKELHTTFDEELHRVMIHGVLHLCGMKDKTKAQQAEMRQAENKYLSILKRKNK
jgi:rRNA maturation RNase YbeY